MELIRRHNATVFNSTEVASTPGPQKKTTFGEASLVIDMILAMRAHAFTPNPASSLSTNIALVRLAMADGTDARRPIPVRVT